MRLRGRPRKSAGNAGGKSAGHVSGGGLGGRFVVGSEVEVRSDDDGFRGAWYEATVLRRVPGRHRFVVAYASLLAGDTAAVDSSQPLHESVLRSHIRPRPPARGPGEAYGLHQLVEAYHNDGWWAGLVAGVEGAAVGIYTVCFPDTREVVEFPAAEVRPRMEWDRGRWVPVAPEQEVAEPLFSPGAEVEVFRASESYGMAWFGATVVNVISAIYFMVEYQSLTVDGGDGQKLKEILAAHFIRPPSPAVPEARDFQLKDEVEAFHRDGWYVGFVSKVLGESKYIVQFKNRGELEMEVDRSNLRFHQEWIGGKWFCPSLGKPRRTPTRDGIKSPRRRSKSGKSSSISTSSSTLCSDPGEHMLEWQSSTANLKRKRTERPNPDVQNYLSQPRKNSRKVKSLNRCSKSPKTVEPEFHVQALTAEDNPSSMDKQHHSTSPDDGMSPGVLSVARKLPSKISLIENSDEQSRNSKPEDLIQKREHDDIICEKSVHHSIARSIKYTPDNNESVDFIPIAEWQSVKGFSDLVVNTLQRRRKLTIRLPQLQSHVTNGVSVNALQATKASSRMKPPKENVRKTRRRCSSRKENITCLNATVECMELNHAEVSAVQNTGSSNIQVSSQGLCREISFDTPLLCHRDGIMEHEDSPYLFNNQDVLLSDVTNANQAGQLADLLEDDNVTPRMESFSVNGSVTKQLSDMRASSFGPGGEDSLASNNFLTNGVTEEENHVPLSVVENEAVIPHELSRSEMPSKNIVVENERALISPSKDIVVENERALISPSKDIVVENERALINPSPSETSSMEVTLPFVKCSPMWESIESMEVFKIMPQQPHFQPLNQYCAVFREGMAIGLMVTFVNLVSDVHNLRIDDSMAILNEKLETLSSLEANGFDVQRIRTRIKKLLEIQNNQKQLEAKKEALERKISEKIVDNNRLDAAVAICDNTVNEIKQSLARLYEKRASMGVQRNSNDSEIRKLRMDVLEAEEECLSVEHHFVDALAAPW